jgi:hypothetical protein
VSESPTIIQLKPSRAEELAAVFDRYAAEARKGEITGWQGILIRPGGAYSSVGWQGRDADAFREMGILVTLLIGIYRGTLSRDDPMKE